MWKKVKKLKKCVPVLNCFITFVLNDKLDIFKLSYSLYAIYYTKKNQIIILQGNYLKRSHCLKQTKRKQNFILYPKCKKLDLIR